MQGDDGDWYATALSGGTNDCGAVIRVSTSGVASVLASFPGPDYAYPSARLTKGLDGAFYGTTDFGGDQDGGMVFRVTTKGDLTVLYSFPRDWFDDCEDCWWYPEGQCPAGGLVLGRDGDLYGTTAVGGEGGGGTLFKITTNGVLTTLASFTYSDGGCETTLTQDDKGDFYGVTTQWYYTNIFGTIFRVGTNELLETLASFPCTGEGSKPEGELLLGSDGTFYGTTSQGGSNNCGVVFRVPTNGVTETLASFGYSSTGVGAFPSGSLLQLPDGALYGTTRSGGEFGSGTVFRLTTNGLLERVASFTYTNGSGPHSGLVMGGDGAMYGTATYGGDQGFGTVFRVTTNGLLTHLLSFACTNGVYPDDGLTLGKDGALYGTTQYGGIGVTNPYSGYGTVFRVTTNGALTTLVSFSGTNGAGPSGGLAVGKDGALYGTTLYGGQYWYGPGTIFRVTPAGEHSILASLEGTAGTSPRGELFVADDGTIYGTASSGGTNGAGAVFKLTTNNALVALCSFAQSLGVEPSGGVIMGPDGALYGTTAKDGRRGGGSVFRLDITPPPPPPLRMLPIEFPCGDLFMRAPCTGPANGTYTVLRATNLSGLWEAVGSITIGADGTGDYYDRKPRPESAFYRLASP